MGSIQQMYREATRSTPEIRFDPDHNQLTISGQSYPENAFLFYQPLLQAIATYLEDLRPGDEMKVEFQLPYINTSSTKCLLMLLERLEEAYIAGKRISVNWFCDEDNESELECAEEFREDLTLPFRITVISAES